MSEIGLLRTARILKGLSLEEVGSLIGLSASALSNIERGVRSGSQTTLRQLGELYGLAPEIAQLAGGRTPALVKDALLANPEFAWLAANDQFSKYAGTSD